MAKVGRPRKPRVIKEMFGHGHETLSDNDADWSPPVPVEQPTESPDMDRRATEMYRQMEPIARRQGMINPATRVLLGVPMVALSACERMMAKVREFAERDEDIVQNHGQYVVNPAAMALRFWFRVAIDGLREFGATPSSAGDVQIPDAEKLDAVQVMKLARAKIEQQRAEMIARRQRNRKERP